MWVYVAGARNRTHCEHRGRRSISWTLPKRWQACVIRRIAFYVAGAGNPHHGSYILRSKGSIPERGCIFATWAWGCVCVASAVFRMTSAHDFVAGAVLLKHGFEMWTLCGDRACRVRGMQVKLRFWISKCNPLRRSCVSSARNAGEIAFLDFEVQPSAEIVRVECAECRWNCDFGLRSATLCGDRACRVRGMQVKLRFRISKCNPLRRSCASVAQNAGKVAISDFIQRSCTRGPTTGSWCRDPNREILHKRSTYRDLAQEVPQDPDADIMTERSCTRDPHTEILHKWSYRILTQTSWQRDVAQEILIQRSCTRGPTGSWCRHHDREILDKRSSYRDLAQEIRQDPDADILTERCCTRDPHTEILHKRSHRILMQTSWHRDAAQEILIQRSCTSGPTGSWCRDPDREILDKRSADRDLAQEVPQDPGADIMTERSCTRDLHTEILRKRSYRILMQTSWHAQEILIQRSCARGPAGPWCRDPDREILHKRSSYGNLAPVIQDSDADITKRSCTRDPQTEILRKRSYRILMQTSWQRDLGQEILIRRSCTSGPTGSWCRDPDRETLHKRSSYRDLAQEVL